MEGRGRQLLKWVCQPIILAENGMKMKEFGPPGVPGSPLRSANDWFGNKTGVSDDDSDTNDDAHDDD